MTGSIEGIVSQGFWPNEQRVLVYDAKGDLVSDACLDALVWQALQNGGITVATGDKLRVTVEKVTE